MKRQSRLDVVGAIHAVEHAHELEGAREAEAGDLVRRHPGDVAPVEADDAGIRRQRAGDQIQRGGLAGAVGAEQADDLAGVDRQIDAH